MRLCSPFSLFLLPSHHLAFRSMVTGRWPVTSKLSMSSPATDHRSLATPFLAGAEGFEPPSSVLETDSLTVELTPLSLSGESVGSVRRSFASLRMTPAGLRRPAKRRHFTSLCGVCLRHRRQNFFSSILSGVVLRFFVVE